MPLKINVLNRSSWQLVPGRFHQNSWVCDQKYSRNSIATHMIKKRFLHNFFELFAITTDVFNQTQSVFETISDRHFTPNSSLVLLMSDPKSLDLTTFT